MIIFRLRLLIRTVVPIQSPQFHDKVKMIPATFALQSHFDVLCLVQCIARLMIVHFSTARTLQRVEHSPDLLKRHLVEAAELLNMPLSPSISEVSVNFVMN